MEIARIGVALLVTAVVAALLWWTAPAELRQPDDIVGYPSFFNFNFHPQFLAHRIVVWIVPLLTAFVYWTLTRWGPWRSPPGRIHPVAMEAPSSSARSEEWDLPEASEDLRGPFLALGRYARLLPAAAILVIAASADTDEVGQSVSATGVLSGAAYLALVLVGAFAWGRLTGRRGALAEVDTVATPIAAIGGLYWFAHHTAAVDLDNRVRDWPWLPWWLAVAACAAVVAGATWRLRTRPATGVERRTVALLGGVVLVFMAAAAMPGSIGRIQGFDDMHSVTGADLLTRGYFPWRDVLFMHGVFEDALRSNVGFVMFDHSVWGAAAAGTMLWTPLLFVGFYALTVWVAPRQWVLQLAFVVAIPWASRMLPLSVRWVAVAFILVLLGEALRRASLLATAVMTAALFVTAILVPEHSFQVIAVLVVLVVHDLTHRHRAQPWWRALRRTRVFVLTGAVLTVGWCVFLASMGALRAWIDYYLYFGPGHAASGALPLGLADVGGWATVFVICEGTVVLALLWTFVRLFRGREFTARHGVLLAAAVTTGAYAEKGLGRFDIGHIGQVVTVAIPLWIVLVALAGEQLMAALRGRVPSVPPRVTAALSHAPGLAVLVLTAVVAPSMLGTPNLVAMADATPGHNRALVSSQDGNPELIGYSAGVEGTDMTMVSDLSELLASLAPDGSKIYDFTNSPGYFTYLMQEALPTRFYTVGLALPEVSQEKLLQELKTSRPSVVVFDDLRYGLPSWDGPRNEARHYLVSPYLLDGWTPVANTYGFLFLLRNDLVADMGPLPSLAAPVQTDDLYFSMPSCEWGHIPDYLHATPSGPSEVLKVGPSEDSRRITVTGWAYQAKDDEPVQQVLVAAGRTVLAQGETGFERPDVSQTLGLPGAVHSGFSLSTVTTRKGPLMTYAVLPDGKAHAVGSATGRMPPRVELPDGTSVQVARGAPTQGGIDTVSAQRRKTASVELPPGTDLSSFGLATFVSSSGPVGNSTVTLFDESSAGGLSHDISFQTLPSSGQAVSVRVGACLQWHGYGGSSLYLTQNGGNPITEVRLSGVAAE